MEPLLDAREVATALRISLRTFETLVARKAAPRYITVGRQRRWRPTDVRAWLKRQVDEQGSNTDSKQEEDYTVKYG